MEELDDGNFIGLDDALKLISETLSIPLGFHSTPLDQCVGFPAGEDIVAVISSPPHPTSIKDGFAVIPSDIDAANPSSPILLRCIGDAYAGAPFGRPMSHGECVRVTAGALLPQGSEAVCASEFCEDAPDGQIVFKNNARPGQNILPAGGDVAQGDLLVPQGTIIAAPHLAAMAASGITTVKCSFWRSGQKSLLLERSSLLAIFMPRISPNVWDGCGSLTSQSPRGSYQMMFRPSPKLFAKLFPMGMNSI